jgi:hypothetical protein
MQSLRLQHGRIPTTLPVGVPHGTMRLESLQENLGRMASALRLNNHLAFCIVGKGGHRVSGRPPRAPRLPHWRLHIPQAAI